MDSVDSSIISVTAVGKQQCAFHIVHLALAVHQDHSAGPGAVSLRRTGNTSEIHFGKLLDQWKLECSLLSDNMTKKVGVFLSSIRVYFQN